MRFQAVICTACAVHALWGCRASVQGDAKSSGDANLRADAERNEDEQAFAAFDAANTPEKPPPGNSVVPALEGSSPAGDSPLLGARHDLYLREGQRSQRCQCLDVGVGTPRDTMFVWNSNVPAFDPTTQVVVAFSSRGQACPGAPEESGGASYRGFLNSGPDVIVMVEAAMPGRPKVYGAVVPRPDAGGQLLLEPHPESLPYGRPEDGSRPGEGNTGEGNPARCVVALTGGSETLSADAAVAAQSTGPSATELDDPNQVSDDSDELEGRRSGFYFGVFTGLGYALLDDDSLPGNVSGLAFDFDLLLGGSPVKDLAIGVVLGAAIVPSPSGEVAGQSRDFDGVTLSLPRFGGFVDYYVLSGKNLHLLAEVGYLGSSFSGSQAPPSNASGGIGLAGGIGYDFWIAQRWSLGVLGRFTYGYLPGDGASATLLMPALLGTLAFH